MKYELPEEIEYPLENSYMSVGSDGCNICFSNKANPVGLPHDVIQTIPVPNWMWGFFRQHTDRRVADILKNLQGPFREASLLMDQAIKRATP